VRPVWTLFSRRSLRRLAYWLSALGYNLNDRSVTNRVYLVYFAAFWLAWILAMLALMGGGLAQAMVTVQDRVSPPDAAVGIMSFSLATWAALTAWRVVGRSPFVFSDDDAYLLCQTPVSRRRVALAWFFQGVAAPVLALGGATVVLAFGLVGWHYQTGTGLALLALSIRASARALSLIVPLQLAVMACVWALGALRLRWRTMPRSLVFGVRIIAAAYLLGWLVPPVRPALSAPFRFPLEAAYAQGTAGSTPAGLVLAECWLSLAAGLALLWLASGRMSLSLAAAETSHMEAISRARSYGEFDLVESIMLRRRLGTAHRPSPLASGPRRLILLRKTVLQGIRTFRLRDLFQLVWMLMLTGAMFRVSSLALQMLLAAVWTLVLGGFLTVQLRHELAHWWLLRSLPLKAGALLGQALGLAGGLAVVVGWLGLAGSDMPPIGTWAAALTVPLMVSSVAMASSADVLRRSHARVLMSPSLADENVPKPGVAGAVHGLVSVLVPFGIIVGSLYLPGASVWGLAGLAVGALIARVNAHTLLAAYRRMD
jgi:hypothetical protein